MFRTYQLKIKNSDQKYFNRLFFEGTRYYNQVVASDEPFQYDTKFKEISILDSEPQKVRFLSSQMRQELKKRVISAIIGLARRKENGYKIGKLKEKKYINSIPLKNQTLVLGKNTVRFQGYKKKFKVCGIKQLPEIYSIRSACLVNKVTGIYLYLTVEFNNIESTTNINCLKNVLGVDFGIKDSLTFSDGTTVNTDFSITEELIKKANKNLSRKRRGSRNRQKAKKNLAVLYQKLNNQKDDISKKILNKLNNFKICFQNEMLSNWQKGLFGKKMNRGVLGRIKAGLKSNPDNVEIPQNKPTTKLCPDCRVLNSIKLNERIYNCECGYSQNRDKHSARNMILIGLGQTNVELGTSVFEVLSTIENKFLVLKQEANVF